MGLFKRGQKSGSAVAEPVGERSRSSAELFEEIDALTARNLESRDPELERRIRHLRHLAGVKLLSEAPADPDYVTPASKPLNLESELPSVTPAQLDAATLRAAILDRGCLLVRGLMQPDEALHLADQIDHAFEARKELQDEETPSAGYYEEIAPEPGFSVIERHWIEAGGGVLAADSPTVLFEYLSAFEKVGLPQVIAEYLGERPALSAQKSTLRKSTPDVSGQWHQDGRFLGDVRAMNVWLSLSRCGDVAPGLDLVPRRLDDFVEAGGDDAVFDWSSSQRVAEEAAGDLGIQRPIFEPGDALLFDELFLHQTAADPSMPNNRFAIESWFFGPSHYPEEYVPIAF